MRKLVWFVVLALGALGHAETVKIGSHMPLTGQLARVGNEMANGIRLAVEHFNQVNSDLNVELILLDDESKAAKAVAAVERLVGREKVIAITGGYGSPIVGPASEVAERAGVPYITSGALATGLTQRGFKYFFRFTNLEGYTIVADLIAEGFKAKTVALLHDDGSGGSAVARAVKAKLEANGLSIVFEASYPVKTTDYKPLLERVNQVKPGVLLFIGYENNYASVLRNAQAVKPEANAFVGLYSLITPSLLKDLGPLMEGVYGTEPWSPGTAPAELRDREAHFINDYKARFGQDPGYLAALGYVQTQILLEAVKRAVESGNPTPKAVRDALAATDTTTLVSDVRFDEKGDNVAYRTVVSQVQNGKPTPVWPPERARGSFVYPKVPW